MANRKLKILGLRFQKKKDAEICGIFLHYNLYETFCLTCKLSCCLRMGSSACLRKSPSKGWEVCSGANCQQTLALQWQLLQVVPPDSSSPAELPGGAPGTSLPSHTLPARQHGLQKTSRALKRANMGTSSHGSVVRVVRNTRCSVGFFQLTWNFLIRNQSQAGAVIVV